MRALYCYIIIREKLDPTGFRQCPECTGDEATPRNSTRPRLQRFFFSSCDLRGADAARTPIYICYTHNNNVPVAGTHKS